MKRWISFLLIFFVPVVSFYAQDEKKQINEIKKDLNFLYAMGTSTASSKEASDNARDLLSLEITEWIKENAHEIPYGYIAKLKESISEISTQRGNLFRVFAYVNKSDVLPCEGNESLIIATIDSSSHPVTVDTIEVREKATSDLSADIQKKEEPIPSKKQFSPNDIEKEILNVSDFNAINKYLAAGNANGQILSYGKYNKDVHLPPHSYVFVFNKTGKILAYLSFKDDEFINMKTGAIDAIPNYGKCGAIWFVHK